MRQSTCLVLLLGFFSCYSASAQDVVLVANKSVKISQIKSADLRAIYTGEKTRFADGSHVVPVTLKGGPAHEVFLRNHLGQNPEEFRAQWRKAVFTGRGVMLRTFDSELALLEYVAATPGALGYVSRVSTQAENVKCLPVVK
jgi:ABC-type phosphate transport system substrate-binding protein